MTVSFGAATYSVAETDDPSTNDVNESQVKVTISLSADPERTVTIPITKTEGGGASSSDYSGVPTSVTFSAGDTSKTFTFQATADTVDDDGEKVTLEFGTLPARVTAGTTDETVVSITDDDDPAVTVSFGAATYSVAETDDPSTNDVNESQVKVTISLSADPERTVTIPITKTEGGGASSSDYSGVPTSVTFSAGDTSKTFTFQATADTVDDDGEKVTLEFGTLPARVTAGTTDETVVSITDDDDPAVTVSFGAATYSVAETDDPSTNDVNESQVKVTISLSADPERTVTIPITKTEGGGASSSDYSGVPTSVTFSAGDTSKTFTFQATADTVDDDGEKVTLEFGTLPARVTAGTTDETVVSITDDDDPAVTVSFGAATYSVAETDDPSTNDVNESQVKVTISLSADPERTVTIPITKTEGGGASSSDYSGVPTSVTFSAGDTSKTFTFQATADTVDDDGEKVTLEFGTLPARVTAGTTDETVVSITDDDDPAVTVSFGAATYSVAETDDPSTNDVNESQVKVTISLSADPERTVTIPITKTEGGGASSSDYSGVPTSVTFSAGDTSKTFTFQATADTVDDDGEKVTLEFGTLPARVTAGTTDETVVSITDDDDPAVTVSFGAATYSVAETDDPSTNDVNESQVKVTISLSADPERTVTIPITKTEGGGASSSDYSGVPTSVTFSAGDTSKTFTFQATADTVDDDGEKVTLEFGTLPARVTAGTTDETVVSITDDDDPAVTVSFGAATYSVAETDDPSTNDVNESQVKVTISLSADPERTVTIPITKTEGGGASSSDYSGVPTSVTFSAGDTSKTFTFQATADTVDDDGEKVTLEFGTLPARVTAGTTDETVVSITDDDDPAVTVSFGAATYSVAETDDPSTNDVNESQVKVTISLSADPERTVTIPITKTEGGGASSSDYSGVPTSVTFSAGDTSKTFTFQATADTVDDDGEKVTLEFGTLPARVTAGTTDETVVSITDDDDPAVTVSFGAATYSVAETDDPSTNDVNESQVKVTISLSADPERTVTIPITKTEGGGASSSDYSGVPTSVTFSAGDTSKTFTFQATADTVDDDGEKVTLEFGTLPARVTAGTTDETVVSITDDDDPAVTVSFGAATYSVAETDDPSTNDVNESQVKVTISLSADPERTVTIPITKTEGGGASSSDYSGVPTSVTFSAGDTSKTFTFQATADTVDDDGEKVTLEFGTLPARVTAGTTDETVVSITDDDDPAVTVSFGAATYSVAETDDPSTNDVNESQVKVTISLSADPERTVTIPITKTEGGGASSSDYSGVPTSVTFSAGDTSKTFTFQATADTVDDDGEKVTLEFGTLPARVTAGTTDETVVSITDDDDPAVTVSFGAATYSVAETDDPSTNDVNESQVKVTISLSADPERTVTIPITKTEGGGASSSDYSGVPTSVTFSAGDTSKTFTFQATADTVDDDGEKVTLEFGTLPARVTAGTTDETVVSITDDDDPAVTVSFGAATYSVAETDDPSTNDVNESQVKVTISLSADPERTVTIPITKTEGGGASSSDYSGVPTSVTFSAGDTSKTFTFQATADTVDDDGEKVTLEFGTLPARVTAGTTDETVVSITDDDDPAVTVSFGAATYSVAETDDPSTNDVNESQVKVTISLSADPERTVTIPITKTEGGGASSSDYSGVPTSVTFSAGDTSKTFTFQATADTVDDDGEKVTLEFGTLPARVTAGTTDETVVSITDDDDPAVTVSFGAATYSVAETDDPSTNDVNESQVKVTISLSADPERTVTIPITKTEGGGASSSDYSGVPTSVTFSAGDTSKTFTFQATADTVDDDGEKVTLEFGTLPARVTAGTTDETVVSITDDDDPAVTVSFGAATYSVAETDDPSTNDVNESQVKVTISLSADPERTVTIPITKTEGGGASSSDYSGVPTSVTFSAGDTSKTFTFQATADTVDDDGEKVTLEFGTLPARVTAGTTDETVVSITDDDDPAVTVSFGAATYSVAETDDPSTNDVNESQVKVTISLSADPERTVTIPITKTEGGGASSSDYSGVPTSVTFSAGDTSKTFTFQATADTVDDDGEKVTLEFGTLPARVTAGTTDETVVSITDDDDPAVTVSFGAATYSVAETDDPSTNDVNESQVKVTISLSADPERTVTIPITKTEGGGASSSDYSGVPTSVTFSAGDTSKTFTFQATADTVDDDGEKVTLEFGTLPARVTAGTTDETVVSITDDDDPAVTVSFGAATYSVAETDDPSTNDVNESQVKVTISLSADPERTVTIPITKTEGGGASSSDYSGVPTSVTFSAGDTSKTFTFQATADTVDDDGEKVTLEFGTLPARVTAGTTDETVVSITDDDDPAVTVSFGAATYSVAETDDPSTNDVNESQVKVTISLSADPERTVTIPITKTEGGGASSSDYSGVPTSVTFSAGDTSKTFTFQATADTVDDDGEKVTLEFGTLPARVTAGTTDETVVSITDDDDPAVTVSFGAATYSVAETDDPSTNDVNESQVKVTISLSADPERTVTIPITKTEGGGASSSDYSGVPTSVTFSAGDTSKTFTFQATADTVDDDGEKVTLEFGTLPARVTAGTTDETVVSITDDDDPAVTVSFGAATYSVAETDDPSTNDVNESQVKVTISLSADPERTVTIPITKTEGGGASSSDYSGVPTSVTFSAGDTSKTFTFQATADTVDDDGEKVTLEFGTLPARVTAGTTDETVVSITDDDDPAVTVSFGAATYSVAETDDPSTNDVNESQVKVTISLSADPERTVTIPITKTEGGGASSSDYSGVPTSVTFSAGDTSKTFTFQATADTVDDDGEKVTLEFGTLPARVTAGTTDETVVSITDDDDPAVTVSFGAATYSVAETDDPSTNDVNESQVKVTISLSADPERTVTIPITKTEGGGASSSDYSGVPTSVTFSAGDTSKTFTFQATADTVDDDGEKVTLEFGTLPARVTAGTTDETVVSITDDDDPAVTVSFGAATYSVAETDDPSTNDVNESQVKVTISLSADPERTVTIPITKTEGGGASSSDYSGVPTSVTFSAGDTSKTFTFQATADTVDDDGEKVTLEFGTLPARVTAGTTDETVVSITDDDDPAVTVSFGAATYSVAETDDPSTNDVNESQVKVTISLSADPERTVTIPITKTEGGGASSSDYSGVPTSVTFSAGDTSKTFTFQATADTVDDDGEKVTLEFGTLPARVTAGTTDETVVSITDDDDPAVTVSFGAATYSVAETDDPSTNDVNESQVKVTISLSADPERTVTIPITKTEGGGASSSDYSGVPTSVTFSAGDTSKTFTFQATADTVDDDGEKVTLEFGTLPARVTAGTTDETVVSITDDDDPAVTVSFGAATYSVAETDDPSTNDVNESQVKVTISLSADPERTVTIPITKTEGGGASSSDYSGVPTSVTFSAGDTSKTFTFQATADTVDDDGEKVTLEFGTLPARVTAGTTDETVVSITDDDDPAVTVSFGAATYSVAETDDPSTNDVNESQVKVTISLSADPERTVTIPITKTEGGGASSSDYSGVPTSVTFSAGDTSKTFTFQATADTVDDDGEKVTLEFGTLPARVTAGTTDETVVSITDDDDPAVTVSFGAATYSVAETDDPSTNDVNESQVKVTISLSADPERTVTIPITKTEGGGASSSDYSGVPTSVTFSAGDTSKTFTFQATADTVDDDGEKVTLEFGTLPARVTAGTTDETVVSITDDDDPAVTVSFGAATYSVAETDDPSTNDVNESQVKVTISLSADPERTVTIPITKTEGGGASSSDYSGVPTSVTFSAGDTSKTFTFQATADTVDDDGEKVTLEFGTLPARVTAGTTDETVVSITDDDDLEVMASRRTSSPGIWNSILTPQALGGEKLGCRNGGGGTECSDPNVMSRDHFHAKGSNYRVQELSVETLRRWPFETQYRIVFTVSSDWTVDINKMTLGVEYNGDELRLPLYRAKREGDTWTWLEWTGSNAPVWGTKSRVTVRLHAVTTGLDTVRVYYDGLDNGQPVDGFTRWDIARAKPYANAAGRALIAYIPGEFVSIDPTVGKVTTTHSKLLLRGEWPGSTIEWGKGAFAAEPESYTSLGGGGVTDAIELDAHSKYTYVYVRVTNGDQVATHLVIIDPPPRTYKVNPDARVTEGQDATVTVSLGSPATQGGVTFDVATVYGEGGATADDVGSISSRVTIPEGQWSARIAVPTVDDEAIEGDESFKVTVTHIGEPTWAMDPQGTDTSTITIENDDEPPPGPEPWNIQVVPGDGQLTVTWNISSREGYEDSEIWHVLRWSQEFGVWANPRDPRAVGRNDGFSVDPGLSSFTITGLKNGVAAGVWIRSMVGYRTNMSERHGDSSEWVRTKGVHTMPVEPTNEAPAVSGRIADTTIVNESGTSRIDLSGVFSDAEGDDLAFTASSSNESVATVSVSIDFSALTVSAKARGVATVTVTVDDGNGGTAENTFTVTVKTAPVVASAIADVIELEVGATHEVPTSGVFDDADGDSLTFSASTSDDAVATVSTRIDGTTQEVTGITVVGVAAGTATITITARDPDGNSVSDAFDVTVPAVQQQTQSQYQGGGDDQGSDSREDPADEEKPLVKENAPAADERAAQEQQQTVELPGAVAGLDVAATSGSVTVSWGAPESGGAPLGYIVNIKRKGGGGGDTRRPGPAKTSLTFRGLNSGSTYEVWVRAQNQAGKGERVHASVTLPVELPGRVRGLEVTATENSVTVDWQPPETGGAPDRYVVHVRPDGGDIGSGRTKTPKAGKTKVTFGNLDGGRTYRVWVRAQNEAGKGERLSAIVTLPDPEPEEIELSDEGGDAQPGQ